MGSSTGRFDVGTERLVVSPIRGRTHEVKVIGASVTAVEQGRGGVLVLEGPPGIGKLDDAAAQIAAAAERARRERNTMAVDIWATIDGMVHLAAGRLLAARAAVESLPPPKRTGATELDMVRMAVLADVAVHTDDRILLQQMVTDARAAYTTGASMVRRTAAYVLALAAWQRQDLHDAMRWLGGDIALFGTPLTPQVLDPVVLSARVAASAGDAGLRARVLQATDVLECERPAIALFTGVADYARGILERDATTLVAAAGLLAMSSRPLLYAAAAEDAGSQLAHNDRLHEALHQLNAAFDTYVRHGARVDARRVGRQLRNLGTERRIVSNPRAKTGWDSLTDSELKVINLIAEGGIYRDVAAQLHLSLTHGEDSRPQRIRQIGRQFPCRVDAAHAAELVTGARGARVSISQPIRPKTSTFGRCSHGTALPLLSSSHPLIRRARFDYPVSDLRSTS